MSVAQKILDSWNKATERSALSFAGNAGAEVSFAKLALTIQNFEIKSSDGSSATYDFFGIGLTLPGKGFNVSISPDDFPSIGSPVYNGTFTDGPLDFDSIAGPASIISLSGSVNAGPAISIAFVFFNQLVDFVLFKGVMGCAGAQLGFSTGASGSVTVYKGYMTKK